MKDLAIKKQMHNAIDLINDKDFLQAVYVILNEKSKEYEFELSEEEKKELDHLKKLHKTGKTKSYSLSDVKKYAQAKLKK